MNMSKWVIALPLLFAFGANAGEPVAEANKKAVLEFYELNFNQHRPTEAAAKYFGDKYIQHNPYFPNGAGAFVGFFEDFFKKNPGSRSHIYRTVAEGDLVVVHVKFQPDPAKAGTAVVDIFRLENGKIVEHFDVVQPIPETTANGNTMFDGSNAK